MGRRIALRHGRGLWPLLVSLAFAVTLRGADADATGGNERQFENLGPQLSARTFQATAFTKEKNGVDVVCVVVRSQPAAKLLVIDAGSGAVRRAMPLPEANGAWAAVTASDGSVYVGTEAKGKLFRWVPGETSVRDLGLALAGESFIWCLASGANGEVYGGTYPGCRVFRYSPAEGFSEPWPGPIAPGETYARAIACDPAAGKLFVGAGVKAAHLIEIDIKSGERREWLAEKFPGEQSIYSLSISGDYLFAMLNPSHRTLIYHRPTRRVVAEVKVSGLYQAAGAPSPLDGKIYFVDGGQLKAFDPRHADTPAASILAVPSSQAMTWLRDGETGTEDWLVVFVQSGELVRFHPPTGRSVIVPVTAREEPVVIQSIAAGPDGRIWMGGYLSGGAAAFDPRTGKTEQFKGVSQAEAIASLGTKLYFGLYPGGRVAEFDTNEPWNLKANNPRRIAVMKDQSRPIALRAVPELNRVYVGTIPEYGLLGGVLGVWDVGAQKFEMLENVVPGQAVASLAFARGTLIGGTTIQGGLGSEPREKEAKLFLLDPATNQKTFEIVPVPGKGIVSGLTPMKDGTVWGFAQGTFFVFDLKTRQVTEMKNIFATEFRDRAMWQDANMVVHPGGDVYAVEDGHLLRINGHTRQITVLREITETKHTRPIAIDAAGRIYVATGIDLWRYTP